MNLNANKSAAHLAALATLEPVRVAYASGDWANVARRAAFGAALATFEAARRAAARVGDVWSW